MIKSTVILTRYNEPNKVVFKSLKSLARQKDIILDVLFLDQFYDEKTEVFCEKISNEFVKLKYIKIEEKGLSYAKNYGIRLTKTKYVHFFDPDQLADEFWAINLIKTLKEFDCLVSCGKTLPRWEISPLLAIKSNMIKEMYSLKKYPQKVREEKVFFGGNVVFDRVILDELGFFNEKVGRKDGTLLSGEDSEFSYLIAKSGYKIIYDSRAFIYHMIPKERISYFWLVKRFYFGGVSKAIRNRKPQALSKRNLWDYMFLPLFVVPYFYGYYKTKFFDWYKK